MASAPDMTDRQRVEAILVLSDACGASGMVAGQVLDTDLLCHNESEVKLLHSLKTGAMLRAACELGCVAAGKEEESREKARQYGEHIGLAFQVRDDVLDVIADEAEFGKPVGSDKEEGKVTFVNLLGLDQCKALVEKETTLAVQAVEDLPGSEFLMSFARQMASRTK